MSTEIYMEGDVVVTVTREPITGNPDAEWGVIGETSVEWLINYWDSEARKQWEDLYPEAAATLFLLLLRNRHNVWESLANFEIGFIQDSGETVEHDMLLRSFGVSFAAHYDFYDPQQVWTMIISLLFDLAMQSVDNAESDETTLHSDIAWINKVFVFTDEVSDELWPLLADGELGFIKVFNETLEKPCDCCGEFLSPDVLQRDVMDCIGGRIFRNLVEWLNNGGYERIGVTKNA